MASVHDYFPGQTFPIGIHKMGWWGDASHSFPGIAYKSDDPQVVLSQLSANVAVGINFVVLDWYGDLPQFRRINRCVAQHQVSIWENSLPLRYAICIDVGAVLAKTTKQSNTEELVNLIEYVYLFFVQGLNYLEVQGHPVIFEFGMETLPASDPIDWAAIKAKYSNISFVHRNVDGFSRHPGAGSYGWIDNGLSYLKDYYARAKTPSQTALCFGSLFPGFDNRKRNPDGTIKLPEQPVWPGSAITVIPRNNGQTFMDTVAATNAAILSGTKLAGVIINTENDYEEGSNVEGGIKVVSPSPGVSVVAKPLFTV